ncbi:MAG: nickel pincer cofactor biosynthesis protein LarB [Gemmatimonadota bacterium]
MNREAVERLLAEVAGGAVSNDEAAERLASLRFETLGFATVDHHRALRQGYPEVVFGEGKTADQVLAIVDRIASRGLGFLVTRTSEDCSRLLCERFEGARHNELGRTVSLPSGSQWLTRGELLIVTAGTSDLPVAEEAAETAIAFRHEPARLTDVGVAGIHRLLARTDELRTARVIVVVAGMDGALPSVVGGLVARPVIAVPTSVGYGASFGGVAALLTMLNSCASGVTVVNIDNGFGAAAAASRILGS